MMCSEAVQQATTQMSKQPKQIWNMSDPTDGFAQSDPANKDGARHPNVGVGGVLASDDARSREASAETTPHVCNPLTPTLAESRLRVFQEGTLQTWSLIRQWATPDPCQGDRESRPSRHLEECDDGYAGHCLAHVQRPAQCSSSVCSVCLFENYALQQQAYASPFGVSVVACER